MKSGDLWVWVSMGLQDLFFKMRIPFDSNKAQTLSQKIQEEIYYNALLTSCGLAEEHSPHKGFKETRMADGVFQFELWGVEPEDKERWDILREKIKKFGLRNSLMIAIAPTATISSISGVCEGIEPQLSNYFKRETLSGEFIQINKYLVNELKECGLWTTEIKNKIKQAEGSIQDIKENL